jgi:8-oxo-dGTP pyrophosphatase MutT (NUDIX family)
MFEIPADRLPPGFAERVAEPPDEPATPLPAATAVLLRDSAAGPEALLLRRHRASGFVPGAYVYPGGRVDQADSDPGLLARVEGELPAEPSASFWMAAVREVLEETGVLLSAEPITAKHAEHLREWREELMNVRATLLDVLDAESLHISAADLAYFAHWITPLAEPRRYDTRFFLARLPEGQEATSDEREMTDALWLTPAAALQRFEQGRLPMVFPTVKTLQSLVGFASVSSALQAYRSQSIAVVLPRLVRTSNGVAIVVDE